MSASAARGAPRLDWRFVAKSMDRLILPMVFFYMLYLRLQLTLGDPRVLFQDAHLYYRATDAWVHGANPWQAHSDFGIFYAAPPPALLLNLPLLPFGEGFAACFWPIAGLAGMILAIRHFHLPWWWLAFPPFIEGILPASPDLALLGFLVVGGGALTAVAKPYAIPAMLAENRWRAVGLAVVLGLVTLPLLPWGTFLAEYPAISASLASQSLYSPLPLPFEVGVAVALVLLGRRGLASATPALWPAAQPHYGAFSLSAAASSRLIALALAFPGPLPISVAVIALAIVEVLRPRLPRRPVVPNREEIGPLVAAGE